MVVCACHPSYKGKHKWEDSLSTKQDPVSKITKAKMGWRVTQVVQHLPSKHKALPSNPSTAAKSKKNVYGRIFVLFVFYIYFIMLRNSSSFRRNFKNHE
jgi:hypothetical protein